MANIEDKNQIDVENILHKSQDKLDFIINIFFISKVKSIEFHVISYHKECDPYSYDWINDVFLQKHPDYIFSYYTKLTEPSVVDIFYYGTNISYDFNSRNIVFSYK